MRQDSFKDFVLDQLGELPDLVGKAMFGGHGLYVDDLFVALIAGDTLYLKADADSAAQFEAAARYWG